MRWSALYVFSTTAKIHKATFYPVSLSPHTHPSLMDAYGKVWSLVSYPATLTAEAPTVQLADNPFHLMSDDVVQYTCGKHELKA